MTDLSEFLLARIAEDEAVAVAARGKSISYGADWESLVVVKHVSRWTSARVLAECEAKRRIVEAESEWRRGKENVVAAETEKLPSDMVNVTWMDAEGRPHQERMSAVEFRERFTEPSPPSDTLKLLALPYADHPEYREEWRP